MKKYFYSWLTVMMIATLCVGFTSCDDDDEPTSTSQIYGTWEERFSYEGGVEVTTFEFKKNGSGLRTYRIETASGSGVTADPVSFTYTYTEDGTISLKFENDGTLYTGTCSITGSSMMLRYGGTYYALKKIK